MFTLHLLLPILPPMVVLQALHLLLWFQWWMIGLHPSQCPITQAQCAQLLSFMKSQSITDWINSAIKLLLLMNLLCWILVLNFIGNTISPSTPSIDSKHSIFSASIVDRHAFAAKGWMLDTGATDHIVHSIPHLTTITFVINTVAHLPILETALVTHKGTIKTQWNSYLDQCTLCTCFNFNLISISHLTKSLFCCFVFISNLCFIQDLTHWSMIGLGKEHGGLYFLQQDFKSDMFKSVVSSVHTCPFNAWHYCLAIKMIFVWLVQLLSKKGFLFVILMLVLNSYTDLWGLFSYHWCFQILPYNCGWLFQIYLGILA